MRKTLERRHRVTVTSRGKATLHQVKPEDLNETVEKYLGDPETKYLIVDGKTIKGIDRKEVRILMSKKKISEKIPVEKQEVVKEEVTLEGTPEEILSKMEETIKVIRKRAYYKKEELKFLEAVASTMRKLLA